jgi:putative copper resistance protein D
MFIRAVHFGSCLMLQSVFILLFLEVLPGWNVTHGRDALAYDHLYRLVHRLVALCLLAAFVSGFLWIWFATASMSGSGLSESLQPSLLWMVLTQTQPGRVWLLRAGIAPVLATALLFIFGKRRGSKTASLAIPLCALLAMALTASLAWLGHAGAGEGPNQNLHLAGDLLHLVAAGIWPAGLAPFAMCLIHFL